MNDGDRGKPPWSKDFDQRLKEALAKRGERERGRGAGEEGGGEALGAGMRIAVDLLAGLLVGTGIGYVLDEWLGTRPWLMIVFFFFGAAAGFLNAYRTYEELDRKAKERKARDGKTAPGQPPPPDRDRDRDRGQDEDENDD